MSEQAQESETLTIISYNSTGFNQQRANFICDIIDQNDRENTIVAIQEHFIFEKNLSKIENLLPNDLVIFSIGSFKDCSRIKRGRGKGGLSLIWHRSIDHNISRIKVNNDRIQCIMIELPACKLLLVNVYFPTDTQTVNFNEQDLLGCIASIENILENNVFDQAILCGDFNCDFSRNTRFVETVTEFMNNQSFSDAWSYFPDVEFSYSDPSDQYFSLVDHFLLDNAVSDCVVRAGVTHRGDNVSGHSPIFLVLDVGMLPKKIQPNFVKYPKQNWRKATLQDKFEYKQVLDNSLSNLVIPQECLECRDVKCKDENHRIALDDYILEILDSIEESTKQKIPYSNASSESASKASRRKIIPGWTELVQPHKDEANFWYATWRSAGKPRHGNLYDNMRFYRNRFRYAKRRCENAAAAVSRDRFIESCLLGDKDLFKELKKFKGTQQKIVSRMDGKTDPVSIADHLKGLYENLYNRTGTEEPLKNLFDHVDETISQHDLEAVDKVTPDLIKSIVKEKIKTGKSDPEFDLTTDNLKNAPDSLFQHLAKFFRAVLIHGYINISLLICAIILLIKDQRGATDDSGNYRGIALSSIILKVFD